MTQYPCSQCGEKFDTLMDVAIHLATHNTITRSSTREVAKPINISISDLTNIPKRTTVKSDMPLIKAWYRFFNEYFGMELPDIHIRWLRANSKNNLGTFGWTSYPRSNAATQWTYCDEGDIYCRISMRCGRGFFETLCTLIHEMVHFEHNTVEGFLNRTWTQAHNGWWWERSQFINRKFEELGSPIRISRRGGDGGKAERIGKIAKEKISRGCIILVNCDSGEPFTAFVDKKNPVLMKCTVTRGNRLFYNEQKIAIPYTRVMAIDGLNVDEY